jgi:MFS family permease
MNLRDQIRSTPMRAVQWGVVLLCILMAAVEGYEIIVMALVAPTLAKAWALGPVPLGYLLSSSILGMAVGSVLLAQGADRMGRRRHIRARYGLKCNPFANRG